MGHVHLGGGPCFALAVPLEVPAEDKPAVLPRVSRSAAVWSESAKIIQNSSENNPPMTNDLITNDQ